MGDRNEGEAGGRRPGVHEAEISRRAMVAGTLATTAVVAVLPLVSAGAAAGGPDLTSCDANSSHDMMSFLVLSAALTGVDIPTLAPEVVVCKSEILNSKPEVDPISVKDVYFRWIKGHAPNSSFTKLLQIAKDNRQSSEDIVRKVSGGDDDARFLARSIVLLWYLGSWYPPDVLQKSAASPPNRGFFPVKAQQVVSAKAYTQGLVWQIAGAHPMGYSNLQFGYWSRLPHDPNGPPGLFSPTVT